MADNQERMKEGWTALSEFLGISKRSLHRRKDELKSAGVIFYRVRIMPNKGKQRVLCWFPRVILSYFIKKSEKREIF